MDDKLLRFFKKINFNDIDSFRNAKFLDLTINKKLLTWTVRIKSSTIIPVSSYMNLINLCKDGLEDVKKINIKMEYEKIDEDSLLEYFSYFLNEIINKNPSLVNVSKSNISIDDEIILVKVNSKEEESVLKKESKHIIENLSLSGIDGYMISFVLDEEEYANTIEQIDNEIKNVKVPIIKKESVLEKPDYRKKVDFQRDGLVTIASIQKEENACNIEAYVFDAVFEEKTKKDGGNFYLATLKISDNTSSILAKMYFSDKDEYLSFSNEIKVGNWYHFVGQVRDDRYAHDLVFRINKYDKIDAPIIKREDNETEKRCELHAHTKMSQMDGVCDEVELVKQAIKWGHAGIAITDHDGVQAYPHVYNTVVAHNKAEKNKIKDRIKELEGMIEKATKEGKDTKEYENMISQLNDDLKNYVPFKVGYGVELGMFSSLLPVCFNSKDLPLENQTFVVFDTETTGFNPGLGDSMIEIGAVKIKDGEVIDRFDELINPGCHIDEAITKVTNIGDDDVIDALDEKTVTEKFKKFIGDNILVAHNAQFDKNMLDMAYYKYDLGSLDNPIIDTLNLSRVINRDLKKHNLAALGKYYGIDTGEADSEDDSYESSYQLDEQECLDIVDILVDGVSVLKSVESEYQQLDIETETYLTKKKIDKYLDTIYKKSKTDKVKIELILKEDCVLINKQTEFDLHPAENIINLKYLNEFGEVNINLNVYVGQHHGADVDAENTAYIFNKMLRSIDGVTNLSDFNDARKLEILAYQNDSKKLKNIIDTFSIKNYIVEKKEDDDKEYEDYPLSEFNIKDYVWKYPGCKTDHLEMYENIPFKTVNEHFANLYGRVSHICMIAKNKKGLKNIFKLVSYANTNFNTRNALIPKRLIEEYRSDCLIGSACLNGEVFTTALTRSDEELMEVMKFYDYIEVQPLENYSHLLKGHDVNNIDHLKIALEKIIKCAKKLNKIIVADGDVHHIDESGRLDREIVVNQKSPGKGRHVLAKYLSGSNRSRINIDQLQNDISKCATSGCELNDTDIRVLKLIYTLANVKQIKATSYNICQIFVLDKNNPDEVFKPKDLEMEKKYLIDSALRKLQIAGVVTINIEDGSYELTSNYEKRKKAYEGHIPNQFFRTTKEMLDEFSWLKDKKLIHEIVITNPNKILNEIEEFEVVEYPDKPYSPIIEGSQEIVRDMVYEKASSMYGNPLPYNIEERLAMEFYGDKIVDLVKFKVGNELSQKELSKCIHDLIMEGYDSIIDLMSKKLMSDDNSLDDASAKEKALSSLGGIIGGGFDVIYLIAQKLVKHSNDDGYLVGSRGSVGSSLVATMMGITECNGLPSHYYCPNCAYCEFSDSDGKAYSLSYSSGFDLPNKDCPKCNTLMVHEGNDMPFATFLGFNADKVPDIDLNFSGENQAAAHDYTKVLFGTDNAYRAGTISSVADKTAIGYVQGYFEERIYNDLKLEAQSYGLKVNNKDDLKKLNVIKSNVRFIEIERLAVGCTGVKRTTGQHPGGIVVVPKYKDIFDFTPFQYPADDPTSVWRTTHFDYHAIDADLLKLDILGHDDPTTLRMLQNLSGIDVTKIDLGDLDTMKIFTGPEILGVKPDQLRGLTLYDKDGNVIRKYCPTGTLGVPEFGTSFLLGMLEETKPTTFAELIKISGLSHGTDVWLGNARELCTPDKDGNIKVPFKDVIGCRDDIMVDLIAWGMPQSDAFKIMEFVRKGKASKDPAGWEVHANKMRKYNIPEWYIWSCSKIKYMFPKAHATAYVTSAFRIAWFKVHYPIYYYCAYLSIRKDQFDIESMIKGPDAIARKIDEIDAKGNEATNKEQDVRDTLYIALEATLRGIKFLNIDIEKSDAKNFVISEDNQGLILPFRALEGLGDAVASQVIKARNERPFISQEDLQERGKINTTSMEKLKALGCLNKLSESNQLSLF